jgi:serine/threonine protein kinase
MSSSPNQPPRNGSPYQTTKPASQPDDLPPLSKTPGSSGAAGAHKSSDAMRCQKPDETWIPEHLGRFRVDKFLGEGAMGRVYKGFDLLLRRDVALKVILSDLRKDPRGYGELLREAKAAAALQHPHVVVVYDVCADHEPPFLVMEYVPGPSLATLIDSRGKLQLQPAVRFAIELLSGLGYAHDEGFIHRDVKPDNVLVDQRIDLAKMVDFGLARCIADMRARGSGGVAGTPCYMAPEQTDASAQYDGRADLFAMGVILFEMLTGRLPFNAPTEDMVMEDIRTKPAPDPRSIEPSVPAELARIIERALQKQPDERYATAGSFIADLQEFADHCRWSEMEPAGLCDALQLPHAPENVLRKLLQASQPDARFSGRLWIQPPDAGFALGAATVARDHRACCRVGDRIVLNVQSNADCYATLIDVGTSGKLTLLLKNHALRAGAPVALRGPGGQSTWEVGLPPGVEKIKAIFTRQPLLLPSGVPPLIALTPPAHARDITIGARETPLDLEEMPPDGWTDAVCHFLIQEH